MARRKEKKSFKKNLIRMATKIKIFFRLLRIDVMEGIFTKTQQKIYITL